MAKTRAIDGQAINTDFAQAGSSRTVNGVLVFSTLPFPVTSVFGKQSINAELTGADLPQTISSALIDSLAMNRDFSSAALASDIGTSIISESPINQAISGEVVLQ